MDRIVPDCIRSLERNENIPVRNKTATRPWQHVLEPLSGYLLLASRIFMQLNLDNGKNIDKLNLLCSPFNFGPNLSSNKTVMEFVEEIIKYWPGKWEDKSDPRAPHEASKLNLTIDKAFHVLGWKPQWDFERTVKETLMWYYNAFKNKYNPSYIQELTQNQIKAYASTLPY